jgi:hypothetical protein
MRQDEPTRGQPQTTSQRDADVDPGLDEDIEAPRAAVAPTSTWHEIKSRFVDDPEGALAAAEDLVRSAVDERVRRLKQGLDELRATEPGEGASATEARRKRLIRYQAYYESIRRTTAH